MKRIFALLLTVAMCLSMVYIAPAVQAEEPVIAHNLYIRDPFVLVDNGVYYLYGTRGFGQFEVFTSDDLYSWESQGACFIGNADFWGNAVADLEDAEHAYWAPEVHKYTYQGETAYYMLATFTQAGTTNQQASAILKAESPLGPFEPWSDGPITPAGHSCLDATLYVENGTPYLIYAHEWQCACRNYNGKGSMDYIQLSDNLKSTVGVSGKWFSADQLVSFWEQLLSGTKAPRVTDGPFVYAKDGQKYLLWASGLDMDGTGTYVQLATKFSTLGSDIDLQKDTVKLYTNDGGHAMVFKDLYGSDTLALHAPNSGDTRARFFNLASQGENFTLTQLNPLVKSGYESYDISNLESGKVIYTGNQEDALELAVFAAAKDDAYVEATLKKGAEFNMNDLRYGFHFAGINFNLVGNESGLMLQITDWNFFENYTLTQQQTEAFENEGIRVAAARVDGVYCMYIENNGIMQRVISKTIPEKSSAWFDLKLNTWPTAQGAVYSGLTWKIGANALPNQVASSDLVISGFEHYNISDLNTGKLIYTGHAEASLELNASVGADEAYVEAVLKQGAEFNMDDLRYGFRFDNVELDLVSNGSDILLQITDWNFFENYTLTQQQAAAFRSEGIRVGAERNGSIYRMYIENNGKMECVISKEIPEKANNPFYLKIHTWPNAKGAEYNQLSWKIGNFAAMEALSGQYVSILGDSISTYAGISNIGPSEGYSVWYNGDWQNVLSGAEETYWGQLIDKYDMNLLVNNSCGGNQLLWNSGAGVTAPAGYMRVENLAYPSGKKPDVIFLFMGTNDYIGNNPLGELTQDTYGSVISADGYNTPTTFTEAYIITIEKALKLYPNAQIYAFTLIPSHYNTNWEVLDRYNARIRQLADHYSQVTLVDIAANSGINTENYWSYTFDGTHPNKAGMDAIARVLETAITESAAQTDVFYMDFEDAQPGDFLVQDPDGLWMDTYDKGWSWVDDEKFLVLSGAAGDASVDFWFNNIPIGSTIAFDFRMPITSGGWDRLAIALGSSDLTNSWRFEQWQGWTSAKYLDSTGTEQVVNEAFAVGTWYSVKMDWDGQTISVKLWEKGTAEPTDYTFTAENPAFEADNKVRFNYVTNAQSYLHLDNIRFYNETEVVEKNIQVIQNGVVTGSYTTIAEAMEYVGDGYMKLMDNVHEEITVDTLCVDLNGNQLSGLTVTDALYILDSYTDGYSDNNIGNAIVDGYVATDWVAPNGNRYIILTGEDGSYTAHRIYVGITQMSLATSVTGFGYKAEFYADDTVKSLFASMGYDLWLTEDRVINRTVAEFRNSLTLRLNNIDIQNYGSTKINAKVVLKLTNGMVIESGVTAYSMQEMLENINSDLSRFNATQIQAVQTMLAPYTLDWNIGNILAWTEE